MMIKSIVTALKGSPYSQKRYVELVSAIYEILVLAREKGVIGLEEHILQPKSSTILAKYPSFSQRSPRGSFLQDTFRPLLDGKVSRRSFPARWKTSSITFSPCIRNRRRY